MESSEWPVVSMDFGRPEVMIVPILAFFSSLVKGLSGMGEALVYGAGWQLFYLAGFEEMNNLGLLAGLICVLQCTSTALLAFGNWQQWSAELHLMLSSMLCFRLFDDCVLSQNGRRIGSIDCFMPLHCGRRLFYIKPGLIFSFAMLVPSPVGNHIREVAPTESVQLVLSVTFLSFALLKPIVDAISAFKTKEVSRPPEGDADASEATEPEPSEAEANLKRQSSQLPEAPSWLWAVLPPVGMVGGFLGGLCGINGPPFILLTAITGLDKVVARNLFPMGQAMEAWTFRLPMLLYLQRIRLEDAHLYCIGLFAGALGLQLGNCLAPKVSQKVFEWSMLLFLVVSSLLVLGLLEGKPGAFIALGASILVLLLRWLASRHLLVSRRLAAEQSGSGDRETNSSPNLFSGNLKSGPVAEGPEGPVQVYGAAEWSVPDADFTPCCAGKPWKPAGLCLCQ